MRPDPAKPAEVNDDEQARVRLRDLFATTPERLWQALTCADFTRRYWLDRRLASNWRIGSPVRFYDGASDLLSDSAVVLEYDPPQRLVYSLRYELDAEIRARGHSRVAFSLEPLPEGVIKLSLVHDQLASADDIAGWREGWAPILSALECLLEIGHLPAELAQMMRRMLAPYRVTLPGRAPEAR